MRFIQTSISFSFTSASSDKYESPSTAHRCVEKSFAGFNKKRLQASANFKVEPI